MRTDTIVDQVRDAHLEAIEDNPIEIDLHRDGKRREGGGFAEVDELAYRNVRCRLYQETTGRQGAREEGSVAGYVQTDARWGLLLPEDALNKEGGKVRIDIEITPHESIWFDHPELGRFAITEIYPNQDAGVTWGWRALCERAK